MTLPQFFERYANVSLGPEPEALATLYAPSFIVGGPQGSMMFPNDERFIDWLTQMSAFNRTHGMRALRPVAIDERPLSPRHTLATVRWGAQFDKTGDRLIEFDIAYLLEAAAGAWTILAYISERDQEEEMKTLGLL